MKIFLLIRTRNIQVSTLILVVSPRSGNTYRHDDFFMVQEILLSCRYFYNSIFLFPCRAISHDIARHRCYCTGPGAMWYPSNHDVL